jgi:hypothetical protein
MENVKKKIEDNKGTIRSRKLKEEGFCMVLYATFNYNSVISWRLKKDRQYNGQKNKKNKKFVEMYNVCT